MLEFVERTGTDCEKWDTLTETFGRDGLIALWVADMDIRVDGHIMDAVQDYLRTGVIGYYSVPDSYYDAFMNWEKEEHGLEVKRDWIRFSPGVVIGFHIAVQILSEPGEAVMVSTPVYYPFLHAAKAGGRVMVTSELKEENGIYSIDFDDFEKKIVENDVKVYLLSSPHNPVSRVWTEEELATILGICRKHGVAVISDEIHHDLIFSGCRHIPTLTLAQPEDRIVMLTAASKSFNIAGFQNSFVVISNEEVRAKWDAFNDGLRMEWGNPLGYIAAEAAYRHGRPWLEEVRELVWSNYLYMKETLTAALPEVVVSPLEGTYLAWVDFRAYLKEEELQPFMQDKCGLAFDYGSWFGGDMSGTHIRVNLATSRDNIVAMAERIIAGLK